MGRPSAAAPPTNEMKLRRLMYPSSRAAKRATSSGDQNCIVPEVVSRAVLELDDELPVSVCCHWTFLIRADLNRPTVAYLHLPVIVSYGRSGLNRAAN